MLAEERLAAGMPCLFTTAREVYMLRPHWHDEEQNLTGSILAGLDYDDFYTCFAPKPAAIGAALWDFFPIEGTRLAYQRARQVYSLFGAEDRIKLFEAEGPHNFHPTLTQGTVEFFNRFLQPEGEYRGLEPFEPEPPELQRNTKTGQVSTSMPGAKLAFEQHLEAVGRSRASRHVPGREELMRVLGLPQEPCPLNPRIQDQRDEGGLEIEKGFITSEPDIVVPVLRLAVERSEAALVFCCDGGTQGSDGQLEKLLRRVALGGVSVYLVEPRGLGETSPGTPSMVSDVWIPQHLRMLGTSLAGLRAYDLARVLEYVHGRQPEQPVTVMARGMVAWAAVLAAVLDGHVSALCLDELRPSIEEFATERTAKVPHAYAIPGILRLADIPQLVEASGASRVLLLDPVDCHGRHVARETWLRKYAPGWGGLNVRVECCLDNLQWNARIAPFLLG
jgi:hypothetical protein